MPPTRSKSEYRGHSCHQCHKQKVKCSRERPCRNCTLANRLCTYAVHDRKITISETYVRQLEAGLQSPLSRDKSPDFRSVVPPAHLNHYASHAPLQGVCHLKSTVENSTAELFVSKLKECQPSRSFGCNGTDSRGSPSVDSTLSSIPQSKYEYFALEFDTLETKCTFKLPPYPYTIYLLDQFAIYLGHDWHWFRLRDFRRRLKNTYTVANSVESRDRIWLCQLLVVLALAESVNDAGRRPQITLDLNAGDAERSQSNLQATASISPPGCKFFEQAMKLLHIPHEKASLQHIEALNLIVLYSFQLNRQKTAYMHAGTSARLCNMLELHKKATSLDCAPCEREHKKRLWWSTYCLDRMTSSQGGFPPSLQIEQMDLNYPSSEHLSGNDADEFSDPEYLSARIQLTRFEEENAKSLSTFTGDGKNYIESLIHPRLRRLVTWKAGLQPHMVIEAGIFPSAAPLPSIRALANLHLRFNQCLILLLRPLLLKQLARISSENEQVVAEDNVRSLTNTCMESARHTLRILIDIRERGLLVRMGFMENMHLFTSLMIVRLVIAINMRCPESLHHEPNDAGTYEVGKQILDHMMQSGSLAAKGHLNMLKEVEDLADGIATDGGTELLLSADDWDVDEWMSRLFENGDVSNVGAF